MGLRSPWLLLKASLSVCRTLLLLLLSSLAAGAACWELLSKQRVSPRLLSVVVLVKPVVGLLSVLVELVVRLLLSVLVELLLVVLVEPLLLSVVVLRELIAVVLLAVVLLTVVLLAVVLLLFTVAEGTDVDVSSKTWNILSPPVAGDGLQYCHEMSCTEINCYLKTKISWTNVGEEKNWMRNCTLGTRRSDTVFWFRIASAVLNLKYRFSFSFRDIKH